MSALDIYRHAPLGAKIRVCNGEPRPPDRFTRKVRAWEEDNGTGTLVQWSPGSKNGTWSSPPTFGLHIATYASSGVPVIVLRRIYSTTSQLQFEIIERPRFGMARILTAIGEGDELQHLAEDEAAAQSWLTRHRYHGARIDMIVDPDVANRPLLRGMAA
ncbi:hypothetical protein [Blastomonas sp.]|uniref:hypothetical protein n=1 Tax=Blastomonas sp. TaxID=1909299 RepID=UPI00261A6E1B|nr:hypothetical protein [Blastomonas sp.]MDM7957048.1 hypothetical protein [Blastomonas sp.]